MRVITGTARGKRLISPEGMDVRPTPDKVKEGVFSALQFDLEGRTIVYHRPHHPRTARAYQVEATRDFLTKLGIRP